MRYVLIVFWVLFWSATSATAQVSLGIAADGTSGIAVLCLCLPRCLSTSGSIQGLGIPK